MTEYPITWVDYELPTGARFAAAFCGYSNKVRHFILGKDPLRRRMLRGARVNGESCDTAGHCLALGCPLNHTPQEHLLHMLDMYQDESLGSEAGNLWGTSSTLEAMLGLIAKIESGEFDSFRTEAES